MTPEELAALERKARDGGIRREDLVHVCPKRAAAKCVCGRHAVQDLADAQAEIKKPCPDCGRMAWTLEAS